VPQTTVRSTQTTVRCTQTTVRSTQTTVKVTEASKLFIQYVMMIEKKSNPVNVKCRDYEKSPPASAYMFDAFVIINS
jgi:hypothetical protein